MQRKSETSFMGKVQNKFNRTLEEAHQIKDTLKDSLHFRQGPKSLGILKFTPQKELILYEENLNKIFYHPEVIENPVMIVSVAGAMREGKSFLFTLLVWFLESGMNPKCFETTSIIPQYFNWKSGSVTETEGINMWNQPFLIKIKEEKQIAVILMDTQGAFDKDGSNVSSKIFAFSTLLSSVQIYNITRLINESHLQPLKLFVDYASKLEKHLVAAEGSKPFQNLHFLIRDWAEDEKFDIESGKQYLDFVMEVDDKASSDVVLVRKKLKDTFSSLKCTLLPFPGAVVARYKNKKKPMAFSDIEPDFNQQVRKFFCGLFKSDNLQFKEVNGTELTGFFIMNHIFKFYELFRSGGIPDPTDIMEAADIANAQTVVTNLLRNYKNKMSKMLQSGTFVKEEELKMYHYNIKNHLVETYDKVFQKSMFQEKIGNFKTSLESEIDNALKPHIQNRKVQEETIKHEYRMVVQNLFNEYVAKIEQASEVDDLEILKRKALNDYESRVKSFGSIFKDQFSNELRENLSRIADRKKEELKTQQEQEKVVDAHLGWYKQEMQKLTNDPVEADELWKHHVAIKHNVTKGLGVDLVKKGSISPKIKELTDALKEAIEQEFTKIQDINNVQLKTAKEILMEKVEATKEQHLRYLLNETEGVYVDPLILEKIHGEYIMELQKHNEQLKSKQKAAYKEVHKQELSEIQKQYEAFAQQMEERKGKYRKSISRKVMIPPPGPMRRSRSRDLDCLPGHQSSLLEKQVTERKHEEARRKLYWETMQRQKQEAGKKCEEAQQSYREIYKETVQREKQETERKCEEVRRSYRKLYEETMQRERQEAERKCEEARRSYRKLYEETMQKEMSKAKQEYEEEISACLSTYKNKMEKFLKDALLSPSALEEHHERTKTEAIKEFIENTDNNSTSDESTFFNFLKDKLGSSIEMEYMRKKHDKHTKVPTFFSPRSIKGIIGDEGFLGRGGFGCVRLGYHDVLGFVAVKYLVCTGANNEIEATKDKFVKEIQLVQKASHQNVVRVEGYTTWKNNMGLIMEYLPRGSLSSLLFLEDDDGKYRVPDIHPAVRLQFCYDITHGMTYLHHGFNDQRMTHGDLKPHNILLTSELRCKIADFGGADFATCTEVTPEQSTKKKHEYTRAYAAPERINCQGVGLTKAMDVYSVGMILQGILVRKTPPNVDPNVENCEILNMKIKYKDTQEHQIIDLIQKVMKNSRNELKDSRPSMKAIRDEFENVYLNLNMPKTLGHVFNITRHMSTKLSALSKESLEPIDICFNV